MAAPLDERRKAIRKFRKQLKLSQAEFAKLAGIGQQMLSRFELGTRDLSPEAFARVEDAITEALARKRAAVQGAGRLVPLSNLLLSKDQVDQEASFQEYKRVHEDLVARYGPRWRETFKALGEAGRELWILKEQNRLLQELVGKQYEVLGFCQELINENETKDAKIFKLEEKVNELRELYDVGTQAVTATARYEELREKLAAVPAKEGK